MKVYISADMEGISGIVSWEQVTESHPEYARSVILMLREVNAAIEGALLGGADEILVNDSHASMRNLPIEELNPRALLLSGNTKPFSMVQGVETGFDLAFFLGYHGAVGSNRAICDHSYSSSSIFSVSLNGQAMSETGINAALCGFYGAPVALVSGDEETVGQAHTLLPDIETVAAKRAIGRFAAICRHPQLVREEIQQKARRAVEEAVRFHPYCLTPPIQMEIVFSQSSKADFAELLPGSRRLDGRRLFFQGENMAETFRALQAFLVLARAAN
ncbi:MAG: M55 family metallopeptidase [bacterium]